MKIGILTLPLHYNYGGLLQAFALQHVLKRMNHEVETINIVYPFYPDRFSLVKMKIKKWFGKPVHLDYYDDYPIKMEQALTYTRPFISKYIDLGEECFRSEKQMHRLNGKYDAWIVGSDQVWRPLYAQYTSVFFLSFLSSKDKSIKISYAASFGTDDKEYNPQLIEQCQKLIKRFKSVSVRERGGINLLKEYGWRDDAEQVLDPTLLLERHVYEKIISDYESENEETESNKKDTNNGIFYYFLDSTTDKLNVLRLLETELNKPSYTVFNKEPNYYDPVITPPRPVEDWLKGFRDSDYILTDSFHGCVFSIIFNKPFMVYGNKKRGAARFMSLLALFGLENRMIFSSEDNIKNLLLQNINWDAVNKKKTAWQEKSFSYLSLNLQ